MFPSFSASSVSCLGQEFRCGGMVCVERPKDTEYPVFGEILHVILIDDVKYLAVHLYSAEFCQHYYAYKVRSTNSFVVVTVNKLVFHKYNVLSELLVVVRSCDHIELCV